MSQINFLAVFASAFSSFLLGGLWYSKLLFLDVWMKESGVKNIESNHPARVFGVSFLFAVLSSALFGFYLGPNPSFDFAILNGAVVGFGFVATSFGINYQFGGKSFKLLFIDGGYHIIQFLIYGLIFGFLK